MSDWISVEDRLPVGDKDVLVIDVMNDMSIAFRHIQKNKWVPMSCGIKVIDNDGDCSVCDITHWQPLPEPPK